MEQGDLLLVPFPFSDQTGRKVRPVVVISKKEFNDDSEDVLVVGVTSNVSRGKYVISLSNKDLEEGHLFTECCAKADNILKVDKGLIIKKIGKVKKDKMNSLLTKIIEIIK